MEPSYWMFVFKSGGSHAYQNSFNKGGTRVIYQPTRILQYAVKGQGKSTMSEQDPWYLSTSVVPLLQLYHYNLEGTSHTLNWDIWGIWEKFEDTKEVIRSHKSQKDRQYNGPKKKEKQWSTMHSLPIENKILKYTHIEGCTMICCRCVSHVKK